MDINLRQYILVTLSYWAFTLTDGALRMLVLLHFHTLGYTPLQIAFLFLFYEFFGVITNLLGGWIASRLGLRSTLLAGLVLQIGALVMLALLQPGWSVSFSIVYVMAAQAISGIAKDLTKMSAKSAIKVVVADHAHNALFKWVAILTGSKNALKGAGFFMGGALLAILGFQNSLFSMASALVVILLLSLVMLPAQLGKAKIKTRFQHILAKTPEINRLSTARFFLFGSRDVWFVVALPLFLATQLGWSHPQVGAFLALWVIGYGLVQAVSPTIIKRRNAPTGQTALLWVMVLALTPGLILLALHSPLSAALSVSIGLILYGVIFALNSSIHSFLILAYTDKDNVTLDVGFYYMANAAGRLTGTLLSGWVYQYHGLEGCLWVSLLFIGAAAVLTRRLP